MKTCKACGKNKPFSEFGKHTQLKDGHTTKCRLCLNEQARVVYADPVFIEQRRAREAKSREKRRESIAAGARARYRLDRQKCIEHYGGKCDCCNENRFEFLCIDHVNGGGNQHRKEIVSSRIVRWLIKNNFPEGYRILCHNCNMAIGFYGYCPHQKKE